MIIRRTKFIDRVNYILICLSDLLFGLRSTSDKGAFPHLFNTKENQSYIGLITRYYFPEKMKLDDCKKFLT